MPLVKKPVAVAPKAAAAAATAAAPAAAPVAPTPPPAAPAAVAPAAPAAAAPAAVHLPAAAAPAPQLPAVSGGGSGLGSQVAAVVKDDGFGDLDGALGFGSFPIVTLKETFSMNDVELGTEFECVLISAKEKWLVKEKAQKTEKLAYSYDKVRSLQGELLEDIKNRWRAEGVTQIEEKKYIEVTAQLMGGEHDGTFVLLSIAPASVNRLGGYRVSVAATHAKTLNQVATKCSRGPKLGKGAEAFYPWNFEMTGELESAVVA